MSRAIVVVDVETSALEPRTARHLTGIPSVPWGEAVECSWWNLTTGEHATFVPHHDVAAVRAHGEPAALTVARYLERLVDAEQDDGTAVRALAAQLGGATLAGSNPGFDAKFLRALLVRDLRPIPGPGRGITHPDPTPWHHRLLDVSAYAAGAWGLPGSELPGLREVCERLGIDPPDHTAAGDVRAGGQALIALGAVPGVSA